MSRRFCATVLGVLAALGGGACGDGESSGKRSPYFGMNAQHLPPMLADGRTEALEAHLSQIEESGVGFVRANVNWGRVEAQPAPRGQLPDVSAYDPWVESLARHRLRWQPTIVGLDTPVWAADPEALPVCRSRAPPAAAAPFARFAEAVARRFGRRGSFWRERPALPYVPAIDYEIWNSPNYGYFWCPRPNPELYAALYAASRAAIRKADSDALVYVAGLDLFSDADVHLALRPSLTADAFVDRMIAALPSGREGEVDAMGAHLYGLDARELTEKLVWFRGVIDRAGLEDTPIVVTEAGWPTAGRSGPPPLDEADRARELGTATTSVANASCGVEQFSAHTWTTPELNPADAEHWYGMADPLSADPYPTADAYAEAIAEMPSPPRGIDEDVCRYP